MGMCRGTLCPGLELLLHTWVPHSLEPRRCPDSARMAFRFQPKNTTNTHTSNLDASHSGPRLEGPSEFGFFGQVGGLDGQVCGGLGWASPWEGSRQTRRPAAGGLGVVPLPWWSLASVLAPLLRPAPWAKSGAQLGVHGRGSGQRPGASLALP